jgi:hypothetical protein
MRWFFQHADITAGGRRSCTEIKRRLGPPDRVILPAHLAAAAGEIDGLDDPKGEALIYADETHDSIGTGRVILQIDCHDGRALYVHISHQAT